MVGQTAPGFQRQPSCALVCMCLVLNGCLTISRGTRGPRISKFGARENTRDDRSEMPCAGRLDEQHVFRSYTSHTVVKPTAIPAKVPNDTDYPQTL